MERNFISPTSHIEVWSVRISLPPFPKLYAPNNTGEFPSSGNFHFVGNNGVKKEGHRGNADYGNKEDPLPLTKSNSGMKVEFVVNQYVVLITN